MRNRILPILTAVVLAAGLSGCSSSADGSSGAAGDPAAGEAAEAAAPAGADDTSGEDAIAGEDAAGDAAGDEMTVAPGGQGPACDVLMQLYQDISTLPARAENPGVTDEDIELIMGPAEAMKADLPGLVGVVLPILRNDVRAATVSDEQGMLEYFARGTHDSAVDELVGSTRQACDLGTDWPGES